MEHKCKKTDLKTVEKCELNREQVIKALECCLVESTCTGCPLHHQYETDCLKYAGEKALSLVKELTEENERLRERNITLEQKFVILNREEAPFLTVKVQKERTAIIPRSKVDDIYTSGKMDGVRQMQERIKEYFPYDADSGLYVVLDQIAEEIIGDGKQ